MSGVLSVTSVEVVKPEPVKRDEAGSFTKELSALAHAFGDETNPDQESVHLLECFLIEYIRDMVTEAQKRADRRGRNLQLDDILHFLKNRPKQYNRVRQVLEHKKQVDRTKKEFKIDEAQPRKKQKL